MYIYLCPVDVQRKHVFTTLNNNDVINDKLHILLIKFVKSFSKHFLHLYTLVSFLTIQ